MQRERRRTTSTLCSLHLAKCGGARYRIGRGCSEQKVGDRYDALSIFWMTNLCFGSNRIFEFPEKVFVYSLKIECGFIRHLAHHTAPKAGARKPIARCSERSAGRNRTSGPACPSSPPRRPSHLGIGSQSRLLPRQQLVLPRTARVVGLPIRQRTMLARCFARGSLTDL